MLGLLCSEWAFFSCGEPGLLSSCGTWASHWGDFSCNEQALECMGFTGLAVLQHVGSSWIRDGTHVPCIGRWILNHWITREVPHPHLFFIMRIILDHPSGKHINTIFSWLNPFIKATWHSQKPTTNPVTKLAGGGFWPWTQAFWPQVQCFVLFSLSISSPFLGSSD